MKRVDGTEAGYIDAAVGAVGGVAGGMVGALETVTALGSAGAVVDVVVA